MKQKVSSAGADLGLSRRDVIPDRSTAQHGRGGTVSGGGYCAARTEVNKHTNVGRSEITVVEVGTVEGHRMHKSIMIFFTICSIVYLIFYLHNFAYLFFIFHIFIFLHI